MIRTMTATDFLTLATGMKEVQKKALLALTADETPVNSMVRLWDSKPIGAAFERDGKLIAVAGALSVHPGVASTFMYATDDFRKVVLEVSHFYLDTLFPLLKKVGVHRVHSLGPANDPGGRRWKEDVLGAWPEATLEKYGKGGEDFVLHTVML